MCDEFEDPRYYSPGQYPEFSRIEFSNAGVVASEDGQFQLPAQASIVFRSKNEDHELRREYHISELETSSDHTLALQSDAEWNSKTEPNRMIRYWRVRPPLVKSWLKGSLVADNPPISGIPKPGELPRKRGSNR